jgi:hypothetical protein
MMKISGKNFALRFVFSLTLTISVLSTAPAQAAVVSFNCPGGGTYSVDNGVLASSYSGTCIGDIVLDSSVTQINYVTAVLPGVTSITIPATTTTIQTQPFGSGSGITAITVDPANPNYKSVDGVLFNKAGTTLIQYPQAKSGTSYTIPSGVTTIGDYAFSCAINLSTITIPDNVTTISILDRTNGCSVVNGITEVIVSPGNANFSSIDGVLFNKTATTILSYPLSKPGSSYVMPSSVTTIGPQALGYSKNNQLQSITLSPNLISIGTYSFINLNLPTLNIPASVTTIADLGLWSTKAITVNSGNTNFSVEDGVLYNFNKTRLVYYPSGSTRTTFTVPNTVTHISTFALQNPGDSLQGLVIGSTLTSVGDYNGIWYLKYLSITGDTTFNFANLALNGLTSVNYCGSNATTISNINAKLASWNNASRVCVTSPAITLSSSNETVNVQSSISGYTVNSTGGTIANYSISPAISNTPGLSFSTSTGLITGTPTTAAASRSYAITAINAANSVTQTFALTVNPALAAPAFTLSSSSISSTVGTAVSGYTINSTGGTIASYSISPAISNTPGLSFSTSTGLITGTPTTAAAATTYTITATNATSPAATRTFAITVAEAPVVYPPVPFLKTVSTPRINLKDGKLICTSGTYNTGYTLDGVVEASSIALFVPTSYSYNLLINGVIERSLAVATSSNTASWSIPTTATSSLLSCSVSVSTNSLSRTDLSTDNSSSVATERMSQTKSISEANKTYIAALKASSKAYPQALADNRKQWSKEIDAIRNNYYLTLDRLKANGISKMVSDAKTAYNVMVAAKEKSNLDYVAKNQAALAIKIKSNKAALDIKTAMIAKANSTYGAFIESIGYGVLIP